VEIGTEAVGWLLIWGLNGGTFWGPYCTFVVSPQFTWLSCPRV
jgi:hypothetical protein